MNLGFWIELQGKWRKTLQKEEKESIVKKAVEDTESRASATIVNPYSSNPLDDFEDDDDEDE